MKQKKNIAKILALLLVFSLNQCQEPIEPVRTGGWILSSDELEAIGITLESAEKYGLTQLILSGNVCKRSDELTDPIKRRNVSSVIKKAHKAGVAEVMVSDPGWYGSVYFPDSLKISGKADLDRKEFWEWIRFNYNQIITLLPEAAGIVLDLSETGDSIVSLHSEFLYSSAQKKAAFADSVATIVLAANKKFFLRGFYDYANSLQNPADDYKLLKTPGIKVIEKEVPPPFLATHPVSGWISDIPFEVIIEFDISHPSDGQMVVASLFPGLHLEHWQSYMKFPNVSGFLVQPRVTSESVVFGSVNEINLAVLFASIKNPLATIDEILTDFISERYGPETAEYLKPAFAKAPDVILSSFYTLGLNTSRLSQLDFENPTTYSASVSGRWMDNPQIYIGHNVDKTFHYWGDIVNHITPAGIKQGGSAIPEWAGLIADSLIVQGELIDSTWLGYIMAEKIYGVQLAREALMAVKETKPHLYYPDLYNPLHHLFNRTLISARVRKAYAQVYYGQRLWNRGEEFQSDSLRNFLKEGVEELSNSVIEMKEYREKGPEDGYIWVNDDKPAQKLLVEIIKSGIFSTPKTKEGK